MVLNLNNKKVKNLSNNLHNMMKILFGALDDEEIVHCELIDDIIKPDFVITYRGVKKYVSMKSGQAETIHQEFIKNFILFLRSKNISIKTQQTILLYQYGDGTMDGTGEKRLNYLDTRVALRNRIFEANIELNKDPYFVLEVIKRCLFVGNMENAIPIDAIYFGDYQYGVVATVRQITKHILLRRWDWMENLHIGPLQIRPHARYVDKKPLHPKFRERLDCYWANLSSDINYISSRYDY